MTEKTIVMRVLTVCKSINDCQQIDAGIRFCNLAFIRVSSVEARQVILAAQMKLTRIQNGTDKIFYTPQQFKKPSPSKPRDQRFKRKQQ